MFLEPSIVACINFSNMPLKEGNSKNVCVYHAPTASVSRSAWKNTQRDKVPSEYFSFDAGSYDKLPKCFRVGKILSHRDQCVPRFKHIFRFVPYMWSNPESWSPDENRLVIVTNTVIRAVIDRVHKQVPCLHYVIVSATISSKCIVFYPVL